MHKFIKDRGSLHLCIVFLITLIAVLGVASISPALPQLAIYYKKSPSEVAKIISIFAIPGIFLTPVFGMMSDRFGRMKLIVVCLMIFGSFGGACCFVGNFKLLLILRSIQGIGAGALGSLNIAVICDLFSGTDRIKAIGLNAGIMSIGMAIYPSIGGFIALENPKYPFLLAFIAIPVAIITFLVLRYPEIKNREKFFAYLKSTLIRFKSVEVLKTFITCVSVFFIFYGVYLTYTPFLMKSRFNASSFMIGVILASMSIADALMSIFVVRLIRLFRIKSLIKFAFLLYAILLSIVPFMPTLWSLLIPIFLLGAANGICIPCIQTMLGDHAKEGKTATFMSLNGVGLRFGQAVGPMVMGVVYELFGINYVFFGGTCLLFLIIFIVMNLIPCSDKK
ncbi:MFS transporter [Ruminiclostridium sufflavum]|nr:MFS transporter [Ruminiclostridium sufflavum]